MTRFLDYLYAAVQNGINFLNEVAKVLEEKVELRGIENADKSDWIKAANVNFKYIKK